MRTLFLCSLTLLCTCGRAQIPLSLDAAIQRGLANNYQIRLARADRDVAVNNDSYALTGKRPTVSLGLSPGISYRNNTNPASIVSQSSSFTYGMTPTANLNWTIFNGGRIEIAKEQLTALANLSAGQLQLQVENSLAGIIQAYYTAVVQREQLEVRRRVLKLSRDRIDYQATRRGFGQGGTFDELQARDAFLNDSTNLVLQKTNAENAVRNLLQQMGESDLTQAVTLSTPLAVSPAIYLREELEQQLLAANAQLRALRLNQDLADINTRLVESENKPTISFTAGANYDISVQTGNQTFDFGGEQPPMQSDLPGIAARAWGANVGVSASYLLLDGGSRSVRTQAARLQEITSQINVESTEQQLRAQLENALVTYENQVTVAAIAQRLIDNAEQNLSIAEERFRGGTINSFDYRSVQLSYVNAEAQRLNALLNLKNTETELFRLTGQIVD
jgi:outer membrane protein TolC